MADVRQHNAAAAAKAGTKADIKSEMWGGVL
jgi:hypothetical protein